MWDSLSNGPCDICEYSRKQISCNSAEELSLYEGTTPLPDSCTTDSSPNCPTRRFLDNLETNSHDSGYGNSYHGDNGTLINPQDSGLFISYTSNNRALSLSFECPMEDEFLEDFSDVEPLDKPSALPSDFNKLISEPFDSGSRCKKNNSPSDAKIRPMFRRALSLQNTGTSMTPNTSRVRTNLFKNDNENKENRPFKRPEPPTVLENAFVKRSKYMEFSSSKEMCNSPVRPLLKRAISATEESIMYAVHRSSTEPDLIGDFSKSFCLPLTIGKHQDLKAIIPETLARLMKGDFKDRVESFKVIDCRYPYEFAGGHIKDAINIYTKEQIAELLHENQLPVTNALKRHILVFHCEFSSERGPNLYRYLRQEDRQKNMNIYPSLHYPEIYLLEGGYKNFFQQYSEMCVPVAYKEMHHPDHEEDLRHFRQKSKTWNADNRHRPTKSLKRL